METRRKKIIIALALFAFACLWVLLSNKALITLRGNSSPEALLDSAQNEKKGSEKIVDENLDTDSDGLPDKIEKVIGTDFEKKDTDGDGYIDFEEVKNGYSPLIAAPGGKLSPEEFVAMGAKIKNIDFSIYGKIFAIEDDFTTLASLAMAPVISPEIIAKLSGPAIFKEEVSLSNKNWKYSFYAPADLDLDKDQPLVIGLHEFEGNSEDYIKFWQSDADKNKFIVVVLESYDKTYPSGSTVNSYPWLEISDFAKAVVGNVEKKYKIDENKIFLSGYTAGATASYIIALDSEIKFRGVILIDGYLPLEAGIIDKLNKAKDVNFYVVHGVNNKETKAVVNQETILMQYGAKMEFRYLPDLDQGYPQTEHPNIIKWMEGLM